MAERVRVDFSFEKDIPNPKEQFWIGDAYLELQQTLSKMCRELGWELEWNSTTFPKT